MQSIANLPLTEALVGHVFDARYRCEAVLEQSVAGIAYRARDLALDELVCLELLPRSLAASNHAWSAVRGGLRRLAVQHHARIVEISKNPRLIDFHATTERELFLFLRRGVAGASRPRMSNQQHLQILEAIAAGDEATAAQAFETHIITGKQRMLDSLS